MSRISDLNDNLILEAILSNKFNKQASFTSDLVQQVQSYFGEHAKSETVMDMLAPGVLWTILSAMGLGRLGMGLGFLMNVLHIDVSGFLTSIYGKVKEAVSDGKKVSSQQINNIVNGVVNEHSEQPTELNMADVPMINTALFDYEKSQFRLLKEDSLYKQAKGPTKSQGVSFLGIIVKLIFKAALGAAGLMVAGDIANKFMGRPNAFDKGTLPQSKEEKQTANNEATGPVSTQNVFPLKSDQQLGESVPLTNTPANIENMIIQFAKDTYQGLDDKEEQIKQTRGFQVVKNEIQQFNSRNPNSTAIFIPGVFTSKKQLVDFFIDQVAKLT